MLAEVGFIGAGRRRSFAIGVAVVCVLQTMVPSRLARAANLDTEIVFHIGAQPLDSALLEFSKQANTPVAFAAQSIGKLSTTGLEGRYVARAALAVLLCNSGLSYTQVGDTVTVVPSGVHGDRKSCTAAVATSRKD